MKIFPMIKKLSMGVIKKLSMGALQAANAGVAHGAAKRLFLGSPTLLCGGMSRQSPECPEGTVGSASEIQSLRDIISMPVFTPHKSVGLTRYSRFAAFVSLS
ncbi:MAG: hypothetical protein NC418_06510 [Muribaculaceae bacterium]|nr:hypothetical protein [Muribaculaceae bacterium]